MNHFIIKNKHEVKKLMRLALNAGHELLKSGAETYRIEDTMVRICNSRENITKSDSFVTPTLILLTIEYDGDIYTDFRRVSTESTNLDKISYINQFSRDFQMDNISVDEGLEYIDNVKEVHIFSDTLKIFFGAICGGAFTLMFGGNYYDFFASIIASAFTILFYLKLTALPITFFVTNFIAAFLASFFSLLTVKFGLGHDVDKIIIGAIMYLVPGVALTNAIRDTMSGDSLSGLSKGMEALLTALAIAFGVGVVLNLYSQGVI